MNPHCLYINKKNTREVDLMVIISLCWHNLEHILKARLTKQLNNIGPKMKGWKEWNLYTERSDDDDTYLHSLHI